MDQELYELRTELKNCKTGKELINHLLNERNNDKKLMTDTMNQNNLLYIVGVIDGLMWSGKITRKDYTLFLKNFGL